MHVPVTCATPKMTKPWLTEHLLLTSLLLVLIMVTVHSRRQDMA